MLNESRGSTLEVVISRMKIRGSEIRLLLVSATVPNICDIANWIGNSTVGPTAPATVYEVSISSFGRILLMFSILVRRGISPMQDHSPRIRLPSQKPK